MLLSDALHLFNTTPKSDCYRCVQSNVMSVSVWVFSPALPRLLCKAHWAWALLWCLQPPDGAVILGHPGRATQKTLSLCGGPPLPAPGVSTWPLVPIFNLTIPNAAHLTAQYVFGVDFKKVLLSPDRRGSMCLKGEDSSEEDLTDSLYSEIDYII